MSFALALIAKFIAPCRICLSITRSSAHILVETGCPSCFISSMSSYKNKNKSENAANTSAYTLCILLFSETSYGSAQLGGSARSSVIRVWDLNTEDTGSNPRLGTTEWICPR